jgi:TRAP transporter TAXI family solute receptor
VNSKTMKRFLPRRLLAGLLVLLLLAPLSAGSQQVKFFRVGTGSTSGTYFPIGGLIAAALSNPPGSRACDQGGSCGVPGVIMVAQSTNGSVDNVTAIENGTIESGFSQADIAYWAYSAKGRFEGQVPMRKLRAIANLYPEAMHFVARQSLLARTPADLKGLRVSLDREGSGTRVGGQLVLQAYGLSPEDVDVFSLPPGAAADALSTGEIDAFFLIAGTPAEAVLQLAGQKRISLLTISGEPAARLAKDYPYFTPDFIPPGVYPNVSAVETLSVGAQWLVSADVEEAMVYEITKALWHKSTRQLLDSGHPKGRQIKLETALQGLTVPLHPGAERYYREVGLISESMPDPADEKPENSDAQEAPAN